MHLFISLVLVVSSLLGYVSLNQPKIKANDFGRFTGAPWKGTLTYLDYGKNRKVSIPANLTVTRSAADKLTCEYEYPKEPQSNSKKVLKICKDGRTDDDETVMERTSLADKTLKIVTEKGGTDNDQAARLRFTYLLGAASFSIKKEVRYENANQFFERNEHRRTR